mgnify:CR=1 FL=1
MVDMLDVFVPPVLLVGDLNKMASRHQTERNIVAALGRTGATIQGMPDRNAAVELHEPCSMAVYIKAGSQAQVERSGFVLASCYGARGSISCTL